MEQPRLSDLDPGNGFPNVARMVVEIPKNSTNKYEYDVELGMFRLDRALYSPVHYPGDYGFVPGTAAEDGDPLDVLALVEQPSFSGCLIEVRVVGKLELVDRSDVDSKILAVPAADPRFDQIQEIRDVPPHVRKEIEHFFKIYKELEKKKVRTHGWRSRRAALQTLRKGRERYVSNGGSAKSP